MSSKVEELIQVLGSAKATTSDAAAMTLNADSATSEAMTTAQTLGAAVPITELVNVQELVQKAVGMAAEAAAAIETATTRVQGLKAQGFFDF